MKKFFACFIALLLAVSCIFITNVKADTHKPQIGYNPNVIPIQAGQIVVGNLQIYDTTFGHWIQRSFHDSLGNTISMIRFDIATYIYPETQQDLTNPGEVLIFFNGETENDIIEYVYSIYGRTFTRDITYFNHPNNIPPPPPPPPSPSCNEPTQLISGQATWVAAGSVIVGRIKILASGDPNCVTNGVWKQMWRSDCNNPAAVTINVACYVKAFDNQTYLYNNKTVLDAKNDYCSRTGARYQDINDFVWPN